MYIDKNGNHWYKGNLHTHTTLSDGRRTPEETKKAYRAAGYDFMALTDHWRFGAGNEADESGLLILSGAEYNFNGEDVVKGVFHVVGVGMESDPMETITPKNSDAQTAINEIIKRGGAAILAHPAWSLNTWDMLMSLENITATEIYNSVSGAPRNCRPYSGEIVDQLAARGRCLRLVADDDTHFWGGEQTLSYIMVNLGEKPLNRANLMSAILAGEYYATQGPIFDARVEGNEFVVECRAEDEIDRITFFTNRPWENMRCAIRDGEPITVARYPIDRGDTFVRAEVYSHSGKKGWSQIIDLRRV